MSTSSSLSHPSHPSPLESSTSSLSLLLNNTDDVERATSTSPVKRSWSSLETSTDSAISKLPHLSPSRRTNTSLANPTTTLTIATDNAITESTTTTTTSNIDVKTPLFTVKHQQQQQQQQPLKEESSSQPYGSGGGTFTTFSLKQPLKEDSPLPTIRLPNSDTTINTVNTTTGSIVKPYACNECEQSFCRPHNLKSHLATHSSIRPYKCGTCDKNFRRLHDLKRHEKLHTGEKPYVCDHCSRSFSRLDALNRHQRAENAARRWSDSDVSQQQSHQSSSAPPKASSSPSSPSPPTSLPIPNHDSKKDTLISTDDTINHQPSKETSFDINGNDTLTADSDSTTNTPHTIDNSNGIGKIKKKSIKSLAQGQQHRFRSSRPNIPQINIPNPATKWPPITSTLVTLKSATSMSLSDITPLSPSPVGSPGNILSASKVTTSRHISSATHESSLPTPETAHPLSTTTTISSSAPASSWNHSNNSLQKLPPPTSLNQHPPPSTRTVLPVIRPNTQQDHYLASPYSPFTPIASPLNPAPPASSHAALLQKTRDLELRIASLEEEKATQAETLNGKIHDLEVENRLLRSLVADSQRLGNSSDHSFTRSQSTESPM